MDDRTQVLAIRAFNALFFVVISCVAFAVLWSMASIGPLGHDEAVYLTQARSWFVNTPSDQWHIYRPVALPVFGWILLHFGDSEKLLRSFGMVGAALTSGVIFLFFRQVSNFWIAFMTTVVVITSSLFLQEAPQFLNDITSSGLLIAIMWLIYIYYKSGGVSNSIYILPPVAALTFYLRYGVVTSFAVIGVATCLLLLPRIMHRDTFDYSKIWKLLVISFILFAPHFIYAKLATKDFFGILRAAGDIAKPEYFGAGLVQYFKWLPGKIGGLPLGIFAIIGACAFVFIIMTPLWRKYVNLAWVGGIGLVTFLVTGLFAHAEARYVFFPMVLLCGTGIASIDLFVGSWSRFVANTLVGALLVLITYFGILYYREANVQFAERANTPTNAAYDRIYATIREDVHPNGCVVWVVQFLPRASWYTECSINSITNPRDFFKAVAAYPNSAYYSIVYTDIKDPQITPNDAAEYRVNLQEIFRIKKLPSGDLVLYRISPQAQSTTTPTISTSTQPTMPAK